MGVLTAIRALEDAGQVDDAIAACERSLSLEPDGSPLRADLLRMQAHLLDWYRSQYEACVSLLQQELAIRQTLQDPTTAHTLFQLGLIMNFMGREADAMRHLQAALGMTEDEVLLAKTENLLGDMLVQQDTLRARQLLSSAANRVAASADDYLKTHVALSLAWLTAVEGRVGEGEAACRDGLRHAEAVQSAGLVGTAHLRLAQVLLIGGRFVEARHHAQQAERVGRENHWQVLVDEAAGLYKRLAPEALP